MALPSASDILAAQAARDDRLPSAKAAGRIAWLDYARGLAMILVVYGHCYRGLSAEGISSQHRVLAIIDYLIYTFHMPVFFIISGVLAGRAPFRGGAPFWLSKVEPILWPYVVWMSVQIAALIAFSNVTNEGAVPLGIWTYLYDPVSPFWFLYALFVSCVFLAYAWRLGTPAMLGLAVAAFAAGRFTTPGGIITEGSWGLLYFAIGAMASDFVRRPRSIADAARAPVILLSAAGALGLGLAFRSAGISNELAVPSALLGCVAMFGLAERLARLAIVWRPIRIVAFIGQASLTVLVVHILGTAGTRIMLSHVLHVHSTVLALVLGTVVGVGGPLVLQLVCTRLGVLRLLGLPRLPRTASA